MNVFHLLKWESTHTCSKILRQFFVNYTAYQPPCFARPTASVCVSSEITPRAQTWPEVTALVWRKWKLDTCCLISPSFKIILVLSKIFPDFSLTQSFSCGLNLFSCYQAKPFRFLSMEIFCPQNKKKIFVQQKNNNCYMDRQIEAATLFSKDVFSTPKSRWRPQVQLFEMTKRTEWKGPTSCSAPCADSCNMETMLRYFHQILNF